MNVTWSKDNECHMGKGNHSKQGVQINFINNGFPPLLACLGDLQIVIFDESSAERALGDSGVVHNSSLLGWVQMQQWDEMVC